MNRFTVRLFARYAELLGASEVDVVVPAGANVAELVAALRILPGGFALPAAPFVAVNMTQARPDHLLNPRDQVAVLPPLAGG